MSPEPDSDRPDWVVLLDGVRVSHGWMTQHTPQLLTAWYDADSTAQQRLIAALILRVAAEVESEPDSDADDGIPGRAWRSIAERIDARLVGGPDWPPLAAALERAHTAGYDVAAGLTALASAAPLPDRHPARELHWRLLDGCPAAVPAAGEVDGLAERAQSAMDTVRQVVHRSAITPASTRGDDAPSTQGSPRPEGDQS